MKKWLTAGVSALTTLAFTASTAFAATGDVTSLGIQGAGQAGGTNPLANLSAPFFQIVGIIILVVLVWRIALNYIRGTHSSFIREILFGILALVFVFDPNVIGPFITWITSLKL